MVIAVRTETGPDGLVVVKEARSDGDVARLSREATMLARSRHPGVVELLDVGERSLRLRHAGTALVRLGPYPLDQAAGIVCAVADVTHALHRMGVAHGDIDAGHVVLDDRGRPRLCGFGLAAARTDEGAADDVAALGRLLGSLLRAGADLPWARPPSGVRRRSQQRQARRELETLVSQATRERRDQRPTARQLAKAIHAAVPTCSLPVPGATSRARPAYAALPTDIDPTADLGWTDEDLSWLADTADDSSPDDDAHDDGEAGDEAPAPDAAGPYAGLRSLGALPVEEAPSDWAELAARPDAVTGPLPLLEPEPAPEPHERARVRVDAPEPTAASGPAVPLPASGRGRPQDRRSLPLGRTAALAVVLVAGVVGGATGARALRPLGGSTDAPAPSPAADDAVSADDGADDPTRPDTEIPAPAPDPDDADAPAPATAWPARCAVPEPAGPDTDGDGCPEPITLDGRVATVGSVTVHLGTEGDRVAVGDWDCDGTATPAVLRPTSGEVFVFPAWSLDAPVEVSPVAVVPDATDLAAGDGPCPDLAVTTPDGRRPVDLDG